MAPTGISLTDTREPLQDGNALIQMFRAIVSCEPADYDHLVGQSFEDDFIENGPSDRVDALPGCQNADR
jgi:hypothetical protein